MKHLSQIWILLFAAAGLSVVVAAGCASVPLRTEASTSGIRAAEEVGATEVPRASLHLQLAREELERARRLAARGDQEMAASMLKRSEVDAELAVVLSRENTEHLKTQASEDRLQKLQQGDI